MQSFFLPKKKLLEDDLMREIGDEPPFDLLENVGGDYDSDDEDAGDNKNNSNELISSLEDADKLLLDEDDGPSPYTTTTTTTTTTSGGLVTELLSPAAEVADALMEGRGEKVDDETQKNKSCEEDVGQKEMQATAHGEVGKENEPQSSITSPLDAAMAGDSAGNDGNADATISLSSSSSSVEEYGPTIPASLKATPEKSWPCASEMPDGATVTPAQASATRPIGKEEKEEVHLQNRSGRRVVKLTRRRGGDSTTSYQALAKRRARFELTMGGCDNARRRTKRSSATKHKPIRQGRRRATGQISTSAFSEVFNSGGGGGGSRVSNSTSRVLPSQEEKKAQLRLAIRSGLGLNKEKRRRISQTPQ